ncbi:MAG: hypothetical protein PHQ04_11280 [Opitutaceae bacterium]|nr:hypothetical protein [Opitutaceae bacterium]
MSFRSPFWRWLAVAASVGAFLWVVAQCYLPGKGFTYFVMFGEKQSGRYLPELKAINYYALDDSYGYDAQYYAQMAMRPHLADPELAQAVDSLPYRARRILFCWTAWLASGGDPVRALHVYAVQNVAAWLLLAWLLLRWFPPGGGWQNFLRWAGVMFSFGLCFSVRGALVDGPSLLLIAAGLALAEMGRPWLSAAILGVSGLGKETNILAGSGLALPGENTWRAWLRFGLQVMVVVLPLGLWLAFVTMRVGMATEMGERNFDLPFHAYAVKWQAAAAQFGQEGLGSVAKWNLLSQVALTVQFLFFALRLRWREAWWRVGASYAVLMMFLGDAVWEGYPGAASRVLLPMLLAFNILVPRGRRWWLVLLLGNLSVVVSPDLLKPPAQVSFQVEGPRALGMIEKSGRTVEAIFDAGWYQQERSLWEYWRWARGSAGFTIRNPQPFAIAAEVKFGLRSNDVRHVRVWLGDRMVWEGSTSTKLQSVNVSTILPPGDQIWRLETSEPPVPPGSGKEQLRQLTFSLRDLVITLKERAPAGP